MYLWNLPKESAGMIGTTRVFLEQVTLNSEDTCQVREQRDIDPQSWERGWLKPKPTVSFLLGKPTGFFFPINEPTLEMNVKMKFTMVHFSGVHYLNVTIERTTQWLVVKYTQAFQD